MSQASEEWDSLVLSRGDFWMIWKFHGISCFHFYFLFRNIDKREWVDRTTSVPDMIIFFGKCHSKSSWSQVLRRTFDKGIWKTIEDFTDVCQHKCQACTKTFDLLLYGSFAKTSQVFKISLILIEKFSLQFI